MKLTLSNNALHDIASQVLTELQGFDCRQHRCLGDGAHSCQSRIAQCIGEVRRWTLVAQEGQAQGCGQGGDGTTHSITPSRHKISWNSACQRMHRSMCGYKSIYLFVYLLKYIQNMLHCTLTQEQPSGDRKSAALRLSQRCCFEKLCCWVAHSTNPNICVLFGHGRNNDVRTHACVALVIKNHVPQKTQGNCWRLRVGRYTIKPQCMNRLVYIYIYIIYIHNIT